MKIFYKAFMFIAILSMIACEKELQVADDNNIDVTQPELKRGAEAINLPASLRNTSNEYANDCNTYIALYNEILNYSENFKPTGLVAELSDPASTDEKKYEWNEGNTTFRMEYKKSPTHRVWQLGRVRIDGTEQKFLQVEKQNDGHGGALFVYEDVNANMLKESYTWNISNPNEQFYSVRKGGVTYVQYDIYIRSNNTGSARYFQNTDLLFELSWNENGSGSWRRFNGYGSSEDGIWTDLGKTVESPYTDYASLIPYLPPYFTSSSHVLAEKANDYIFSMNYIHKYTNLFLPPADAQRVAYKTSAQEYEVNYKWMQRDTVIHYTYKESQINKFWQVEIETFKSGRVKYFEAQETWDGLTGSLYVYDVIDNKFFNQLKERYTWAHDLYEKNYFVTELFNNYSGKVSKYEITINSDFSGKVNNFIDESLLESVMWNLSGSVNYETYYNGVKETGSF